MDRVNWTVVIAALGALVVLACVLVFAPLIWRYSLQMGDNEVRIAVYIGAGLAMTTIVVVLVVTAIIVSQRAQTTALMNHLQRDDSADIRLIREILSNLPTNTSVPGITISTPPTYPPGGYLEPGVGTEQYE